MDKRYQIFVSSTYADLKEERQRIIQALMQLDCIPAGMELFPAADEDQFAFIKRVIDDCDYYILLIGGRYGSLACDGISYTEQEYEYALSKGLKVIALLHENPDDIPLGKSELEPSLREQLKRFRDRVSTGRLVKFWNSASELPGLIALSLPATIKAHPARGWVRADKIANETVLGELNDVRKENGALSAEIHKLRGSRNFRIENLAGLDELFELGGRFWKDGIPGWSWKASMTWSQIFAAIGPYLVQCPKSTIVKNVLGDAAFKKSPANGAGG